MLQSFRGIAKYIWILVFIVFVGTFLLGEVSGLLGRAPITPTTAVAKVNGTKILYTTWQNAVSQLASEQERRSGHSLNLDERQQIDEQAFNQLVSDVLLQQEYEKRGIHVTDAEVREAFLTSPPPEVYNNPSFQTDGRFDQAKYQRFVTSSVARQQGIAAQLEGYYRTELPKQKLISQLISDAYVGDERLWRIFRDERDSASVQYVAFRPTPAQVTAAQVTDDEARAFYDRYPDRWERAGSALISVLSLSRVPTAADTAATAARLRTLREEIASGRSSFEDVAKRESEDTISGPQGGDLGRGKKGRFVADFETAAFALRVGQLSEPVKTSFGWHLIKATERKGDTLAIRHILLTVKQDDSSATATDRRADQLSAIAGGATEPAKFDSAATTMGLLVTQIPVQQGQSAQYMGRTVGGLSGAAFSGMSVGETSDLIDTDEGYYLVRLDSLRAGGKQPFAVVKADIMQILKERRAAEGMVAQGEAFLASARANGLATAATQAGLKAEPAGPFTRAGFVPGLGYFSEAVGAAFAIPVGSLGMVRTDEAVIVMQVTSRVEASRDLFEVQKADQRARTLKAYREQKVQIFFSNLRRMAKVADYRQELYASARRQTVAAQ